MSEQFLRDEAVEPDLEATVKVGEGLRVLDQRGTMTIAGGQLTLLGHEGDLIARAGRRGNAQAGKANVYFKLTVNGTKYALEPKGRAHNLIGVLAKAKQGQNLTATVLEVIAEQGGQVIG
ncbi:MAG TPA: hypothetical protein VHX88_14030 [Solirubrobacteraceae bacterium]|jgi:hypothetical protein|nr:hypothetical protein [Solirubrobacteraceae bacterium]